MRFERESSFWWWYGLSVGLYSLVILGILLWILFLPDFSFLGKILSTLIFVIMLFFSYQSLRNCVRSVIVQGTKIVVRSLFGKEREIHRVKELHFLRWHGFMHRHFVIEHTQGKTFLNSLFGFQDYKDLLRALEKATNMKITWEPYSYEELRKELGGKVTKNS